MISNASATDVVVVPSSKVVAQGQTFNLNVSIDPKGTAVAGAQLNIAFNKSIINVNGITEGNLFKQSGASTFFREGVIDNSSGLIVDIFDIILGSTNVSASGTFIIINATAIGSRGASGINLSKVKIVDPDGNAVALNVINGSVSINTAPTPTPTSTPAPTPTPSPKPSIFGNVFDDKNGNKRYDNGESGLQGWTIKLRGYDTASRKIINTQIITDANGYYSFTGLNPGYYFLSEGSLSGWKATTQSLHFVKVTPGSSSERNFGNRRT